MGRLSFVRVLAGVLLVGSAALAQQGLIVEPWRAATPAPAPIAVRIAPAARPAMPASGLPPVDPVAVSNAPQARSESRPWKPPVVALLVDPWAKSARKPPATEREWVPLSTEIVDPWATKPRSVAARREPVASHSTIF